jgi:hypothetical protein
MWLRLGIILSIGIDTVIYCAMHPLSDNTGSSSISPKLCRQKLN